MIPSIGRSVLRQARTQFRQKTGHTPIASISALARLLSSLAVLEQKDGQLNHGSLGAVTAAQKLGGSITAFIAGDNIKAVAVDAAKVAGIEKIISVDNPAYDKVNCFNFVFYTSAKTNELRVYQKTMPHCSLKTSRREDLHILLPGTLRSERTFCPEWQLY